MKKSKVLRNLIIVLLIVVATVLFLRSRGAAPIESGSTLVLELEGDYVESPQPSLLARALGESQRPFLSLLSRLAIVERDDRIDTVVLVIRPLGMGWGKAEELRASIKRLRESGRKVVAFLDMASFKATREYFVATAADEIYVVQGGAVPVVGLAAEYLFLGGLWDKLGVSFDVGKAGKYKSAVEYYTGTDMSAPNREMASSLLDSANGAFLEAIAEGRDMSLEAVRVAVDQGPVTPAQLIAQKLIDGVRHLDGLLDEMPGQVLHADDYAHVDAEDVGFSPVASVALVYGSGSIVQGRASRSPGGSAVMASQTFSALIEQVAADPEIDAIILRLDSPGGSALASEEMWQALVTARNHGKPVVASFSDVAASGGYYVAAAADSIVSNGGTLTGSIGVFALRPVLAGTFDKLGIARESMTRGAFADLLLAGEPLSDGARSRLQGIVLEIYQLFLARVSEGRGLDISRVDAVAQGRVWTGRQAFEVGLVDEIGGLHTAVARVRKRLELDPDSDVALLIRPAPKSLSEEIAELFNARVFGLLQAAVPLPEGMRALQSILASMPSGGPLLVPPVWVQIH